MAEELETKVTTPEFRASYSHVWEKHKDQYDNEKYSICMVWPDGADLSSIKKAIMNCMINKYGADQKKWGKDALKAKASVAELLMKGDEQRPDDPVYADCMFMSAKSDNKVGVVDSGVNKIMDQDEFYSGCYARASIRFYIPKKFHRVCCALNNVMKIKDGEPLSGGSSAEEDFAEFVDPNATAQTTSAAGEEGAEDWM